MPECIFCEIVAGRAPAVRVYETDLVLAFADVFPLEPGHTLVVPKQHVENIYGLDPALAGALGAAVARVAQTMKRTLAPDGITVFQANEAAGGQSVFHYHCHVVPRHAGRRIFTIHHGRERANPAETEALLAPLREALR